MGTQWPELYEAELLGVWFLAQGWRMDWLLSLSMDFESKCFGQGDFFLAESCHKKRGKKKKKNLDLCFVWIWADLGSKKPLLLGWSDTAPLGNCTALKRCKEPVGERGEEKAQQTEALVRG